MIFWRLEMHILSEQSMKRDINFISLQAVNIYIYNLFIFLQQIMNYSCFKSLVYFKIECVH